MLIILLINMVPIHVGAIDVASFTASTVETYAGNTVNVEINGNNLVDLGSFELEIHYDSDVMSVSDTYNGYLCNDAIIDVNTDTAGVVKVNAISLTGISGSGTFLNIYFEIKNDCAAGEYPITVTVGDAYDTNLQVATLSGGKSFITVKRWQESQNTFYIYAYPSSSWVNVGDKISYTVCNSNGYNFASGNFTINYDHEILQLDTVDISSNLKVDGCVYDINTSKLGQAKVAIASNEELYSYDIVTATFTVLVNEDVSTILEATASDVYDDNLSPYLGSTTNYYVYVSKTEEAEDYPDLYFKNMQNMVVGEEYTTTLSLESGAPVAAADFVVNYDTDVFECISVTVSKAASSKGAMVEINNKIGNGTIKFSYINMKGYSEGIDLVDITWKAKQSPVFHSYVTTSGSGVKDVNFKDLNLEYKSAVNCIYGKVITEPTCSEQGYTTYSCSCGESYVQDYVEAAGHSYTSIEAIAPTCTKAGKEAGRECTRCNYTEGFAVIPATGHTYTSKVTKEPTCTETGVETYTCISGDDSYTKTLSKLGHDLKSISKVEPTCTVDGKEAGKECTRCNYTEGFAVIPATGHTYTSKVTTEPTCTETGVETYTCTSGDDSYTKVLAKLGHNLKSISKVEPTCTVDGKEAGKECTRCSYTEGFKVLPATGHTYTSKVTTEPTCTETGVETYTCTSGDDSYTKVLAKLGHDLKSVSKVEPTCTADGREAGKECTRCSYTEGLNVLPALGHDLNDIPKVDATCTEDGKEAGKECTRCDYTEGFAVIPATGHTYTSQVTKEATCTEEGEETYTCTLEDDSYTIPIDALGHDLNDIPKVEATCTEEGKEAGKECTRCEYLEGLEVIPAMGHSCTQYELNGDGTKTAQCDGCGAIITVNDEVYGGRLSDTIIWFIDSVGTLYVKGTGEIPGVQWNEYRSQIKFADISEGIVNVPDYAFYECCNLEKVNLPTSVSRIGKYAFEGCSSLESVKYFGTSEQWNAVEKEQPSGLENIEIILLDDFQTIENADGTLTITGSNITLKNEFTVPSMLKDKLITGIGENAFAGYTEMTKVIIPQTITFIGAGAFELNPETVFVVYKNSAAYTWLNENGFTNLDVKIPLEEIKLPGNISLTCGDVKELNAEILPADTTDEVNLEWIVSDETVVRYDVETGLLTAVGVGCAEVTVTDLNSGMNSTAIVTVKLPADEMITVASDAEIAAIGLQEGEFRRLVVSSMTAGEIPADKVDFVSSEPTVVAVDENGVITSLYAGAGAKTVTITATLKSDKTKTVKFAVKTIAKQAESIVITAEYDNDEIEIVTNDDGVQLIIIPKELIKNGTLPIKLHAVSKDFAGNEIVTNVKWTTDASNIAKVVAVKGTTDSADVTIGKNIDGLAVITATANDIKKTTATIEIDVRDYTPRLETNSVTLNTNQIAGAEIKLYTAYDAILAEYSEEIALFVARNTMVTNVTLEGHEDLYAEYADGVVAIKAADVIKNGTYKLTLKIDTAKGETSQPVTVKVANTLPTVTVTQLATFNRFYKDSQAEIKVIAKDAVIMAVELADTPTFTATEYNTETDSITLVYADQANPLNGYVAGKPDVTANVKVYIDGYRTPVVKALSIKHGETAPKLALSRSSTAYTYLNNSNSPLQIVETVGKDKEVVDLSEYAVTLMEASQGYVELSKNGTDILLTTILSANNKFANNATKHSTKFEVNHNNWLKPMVFTHTITVNTAKPTLKAKVATLSISTLYNAVAETELTASIANCPVPVRYEIAAVKPNENTAKLHVTASGWILRAEFADMNDLPANGTYEFSVVPVVENSDQEEISLAAFKVKVTVNNKVPTVKAAQSTVTLKGEDYTSNAEVALTVSPVDCPEIRYEVVPATASQKANTDKLVVTAEGRTVTVGFADVNNLPANGSYKYTIKGFITDAAGNEKPLTPTTITVKVATTAPKVTFEKTAVTLNKDVAEAASFGVKALTSGYEVVDMVFTTTNTKAEGKMEVSYDKESGLITAKVTDTSLANGTYTYNGVVTIKVARNAVTTTQMLKATVKVTVKSGAVSLKTSAKGSIDLTNRENGIVYTITGINNYNYEASMINENSFRLTGADKDKFDISYTGLVKGQHTVMVTAKSDAVLSNKAKYIYNIAVNVEGITEAVSLVKDVNVTTKQTALKFKVTGSTTIYQSYKGTNNFKIEVTGPAGAQIENVVKLDTKATTVPDGALVYSITSNEDGSWQVSYRVNKAAKVKVNKTYKVAFEIIPEGNGENVKPQTLTVTLKVKR